MNLENPYSPPESDVSLVEDEEDHLLDVHYANFGERLGAYIMDYIFVSLIMMVLLAFTEYTFNDFVYRMDERYSINVGYLVVGWLYASILESSKKQATWGKQMMKIKVTDLNGEKISYTRAVFRDLGKLLSGIIIFLGFFMMTWTKKKQTLHDLMSGCLVIKK